MVRCMLALVHELRSSHITPEFCVTEGISYDSALRCRERLEQCEHQQGQAPESMTIVCLQAPDSESTLAQQQQQRLLLRLHCLTQQPRQQRCSDWLLLNGVPNTQEFAALPTVKKERLDTNCDFKDGFVVPSYGITGLSDMAIQNVKRENDGVMECEGELGRNLMNDPLGLLEVNMQADNGRILAEDDNASNGSHGSSLNSHNVKVRRFYCDYCNFSCTGQYLMKRHILKHKGQARPKLYCPLCSFHTFFRTSFNDHLDSVHMNSRGELMCTRCDYASTYKGNLYRHVNRHSSNPQRIACPLCPYVCAGNITRHLKKHASLQEGKSKCPLCDFSTWNTSKLQDHLNSHTGENKLTCEVCQWSTYYRQHFAKHMTQYHSKGDWAGPG